MAQTVRHLPAMQETWVQSLGWEDPLEKEMATHSSTLAWKLPRMEEPVRLQSMGSQRVGHDWATSVYFMDEKQKFNLKLEKALLHPPSQFTGPRDPQDEGFRRNKRDAHYHSFCPPLAPLSVITHWLWRALRTTGCYRTDSSFSPKRLPCLK